MSNPTETLRAILEAIPHPGGLEALAELEAQHGWVYCPICGSCGIGGCCAYYCDKCHDRHDGDNDPTDLGDAAGAKLKAAQDRIAELEEDWVQLLHSTTDEILALGAQVHTLREALEMERKHVMWKGHAPLPTTEAALAATEVKHD